MVPSPELSTKKSDEDSALIESNEILPFTNRKHEATITQKHLLTALGRGPEKCQVSHRTRRSG